MSIHMPTLFDDEEYFVPPSKKEGHKKKDLPEAKDEALNEEGPEPAADPVAPSHSLTEANQDVGALPGTDRDADKVPEPTADLTGPEQPTGDTVSETDEENSIQTEPAIALTEDVSEVVADEAVRPVAPGQPEMVEAPETNIAAATPAEATGEEQGLVDEPKEAESKNIEIAAIQAIELEQDEAAAENIAAAPLPEIVEVSAVDQLSVELPKPTPGITFEIPEEEAPGIELEMTARPVPAVREDKVDDLDQLMRTELISQDYTAFSGFEFEPLDEKKKIIPEPEAEVTAAEPDVAPEKENISLAAQEIDAAGLDFEFESDALASSLPEFVLENKYYTIGEVAALFAVNVSHIRFWTTEFNLKVRTTRKGDRLYNPENIARLRLIHHLVKENGFTIKGAKDKLKHQKQNVSAQIDLKNKLSGLKDKLERIKKNL